MGVIFFGEGGEDLELGQTFQLQLEGQGGLHQLTDPEEESCGLGETPDPS